MWTIWKEFRFEAAHRLPDHDGKCARLHGHSWVGRVFVRRSSLQTEGPQRGMTLDYGRIKERLAPLLETLDHANLNDLPGLENPTAEVIAEWLFARLWVSVPDLLAVEIEETCTSGCRYAPEPPSWPGPPRLEASEGQGP